MDLKSFSALEWAHKFIREHVKPGDLCIDATAGRGHDTALLCGLVGETGHVTAFDIQSDAIASTNALLAELGYTDRATVIQGSHSTMGEYAQPGTISCITFNFGWLPGGDHNIFTHADTSIAAIGQGLELLREDGIMSLCIYYGRETGFAERDALLAYLRTIDSKQYTVMICEFANRSNCPPIPVLIWKGK